MGTFFGHKLRAAVLWQLFNLTAHEPARAAALDAYKKARDAWAALADAAKVYVDDLTFGPDRHLRRHWKERLADIDADIAGLATRGPQPRNADYQKATIDKLIEGILAKPAAADARALPAVQHEAPASFKRGEPIRLWVGERGGTLYYRHLHQGERYQSMGMEIDDVGYVAIIPGAYTDTAFPIQYYFEFRTDTMARMYPGFGADFTGQPYFLVQPE
jgi:hypothetical protein